MNKILIAILALFSGSIVAYYIVNGNGNGNYFVEVNNIFERNVNKTKLTGLEKAKFDNDEFNLEKIVKENQLRPVSENIMSETKTLAKCIKAKTCLEKVEGKKFYDVKMDSVWTRVAIKLSQINEISEYDVELLNDISNDDLNLFMSFENDAVFFISNILLYKKGKESVLSSHEVIKDLDTELLSKYLVNLSNSDLIEENAIREMRNEVIKHQLDNQKMTGILNIASVLNNISFLEKEVVEIKDSFCLLELERENESQIMLESKFATFFRKYQVSPKC